MKRLLTIILTLIMAASLLTACGTDQSGDKPVDQTHHNPNDNPIIVIDGGEWFLDEWWSLQATIDQELEIGAAHGAPGMYMNFSYDITMVKELESDDASITGDYYLCVDSVVTLNSDEAVDHLLSEQLGVEVSGYGFGVNTYEEGHYSNAGYLDDEGNYVHVDAAYVQNVSNNWHSVIKDRNGHIVKPPVGSYLMFEQFTMSYMGSATTVLGSWYGISEVETYLFIVIDPDQPGVELEIDRPVRVYMTFPDWPLDGSEVWFEGSGTLSLHYAYSHS